ncbi:MAG: DUF1015 domain-containing protein [Ruminococcaceae bacterium]|nr:DUF1015 domain-containing protein [Oscillospiraceae bacterium]
MNKIFSEANILLPCFINNSSKAEKWAVVACDQFTSEPEYWREVYNTVGENPSTVNMILPEVFLSEESVERLDKISCFMRDYEDGLLKEVANTLIYVRRVQSDGKIRCGIVGKIDLEEYDYSVGSKSAVRATEGTVLERIPPRVAVRRAATVELPHIMLLIDDVEKTVIEPWETMASEMKELYDFDLMLGGGHVQGYALSKIQTDKVFENLNALFAGSDNSIKFAVGDGNHSLASAKARYEEIKAEMGEEAAKNHPLRYALCEVVNLHDSALEFEPIYRLVKTNNKEKLLSALIEYGKKCEKGTQTVKCISDGGEKVVSLGNGTHSLAVGTLQKFLDEYKKENPQVEIDYIHGIDSIYKLSQEEDSIGFVFEGMKKEELFFSVENDGALPRKTFSMGEAKDKRYYIECRKISI